MVRCVISWPPSLPAKMESDHLVLKEPAWPQKPGNRMMSHPSWGCWTWRTLQRRAERNAAIKHLSRKMLHYC